MAGLRQTTASLARYRRQFEKLVAANAKAERRSLGAGAGRLREVTGFGSNPGSLRMLTYVPESCPAGAPLVVVLHGCTQTAEGYDAGAGWSTLADRYGFALLLPEQQRANNPNNCFNWFQPGDTARGSGEALSIRQMIDALVSAEGLDPRRIFVTGLSAGGAMTAAMLASYPEVFAGGAILAGLPFGIAANVQEALDGMFRGKSLPRQAWGDLVRGASEHRGPWPKLSIWHGSADTTVQPGNAGELIKQWTDVHGLPPAPTRSDTVDGYPRQQWQDASGETLVEAYSITGLAHGTPIAAGDGETACGAAGPFILEAGISSSYRIAAFWGITGAQAASRPKRGTGDRILAPVNPVAAPIAAPPVAARSVRKPALLGDARPGAGNPREKRGRPDAIDPGSVITAALRKAGLLK